jgi:hypothetical protein
VTPPAHQNLNLYLIFWCLIKAIYSQSQDPPDQFLERSLLEVLIGRMCVRAFIEMSVYTYM